ncbi:MAG: 6-pyruvoyl trahydropterin synthase family protein [Candidatus Kapaibacteriota bacterium]|jgi:6-pyruvoyltetrahydropterin/6-carboxytetrahydropterin synthase
MKTRIAKEFHWEMAHRLPLHAGGCQNVHGHSYKLWVELEGEPDSHGMVMDYYDLKTIVEPLVKQLDHSFLCDRSDELMMRFFHENTLKVNYVDFPTTAENIAVYLLKHITTRLRESQNVPIKRLCVRVHETERTYAEVFQEF